MSRATARLIVAALCLASCAFPAELGRAEDSGGGAVFDWSRFTEGLRIRAVHLRFASEGTNLPPRVVTTREEAFTDAASAWTKGCMPDGPFELMQATNLPTFPDTNAPVIAFVCSTTLISVSEAETNAIRRYVAAGGMVVADYAQQDSLQRLRPDSRLVVVADDDPLFQEPFCFPSGLQTNTPPIGGLIHDRVLGARVGRRWGLIILPLDYSTRWWENTRDKNALEWDSMFFFNLLYYAMGTRKGTTDREASPRSWKSRDHDRQEALPVTPASTNEVPSIVREITGISNPPPRETSEMLDREADSFRRTLDRKDDRLR